MRAASIGAAGGEFIATPNSAAQAEALRDGLAKALYAGPGLEPTASSPGRAAGV